VVHENDNTGNNKKNGYPTEFFNFACILRGEASHLEEIKAYIIGEYVDKGLVKLINPAYDTEKIYIVTDQEWEEYQNLKKRDDRLIGAGFL
jgi:hypothetical protein